MSYLYHIVKEDFEGGTIYPLSVLKEVYPEKYGVHAAKYTDRKHVTELFIPQLQCYWNDVVHLSAVNPNEVVKKLRKAGAKKHTYSYYEIDPTTLDRAKTVVYPNNPRENSRKVSEKDFVAFDPDDLEKWNRIPDETVEYYEKSFAEGKRPLLFVFVPHILYKGTIDVSDFGVKKTISED